MSLEMEDRSSLDKAIEESEKMSRQSRISYTREFLLSFSELEGCKKLPSGFDESILSEFADASSSIQDRPRTFGSASLQGFRRTEYGSSPPTRGDNSTYSRGAYGRWDNRSSGRNDRDLDSQSDKDSDSGRRFGSNSRRSWQGPEHDGLLGSGSGSFPKPSGFGGGISAPKNIPNDPNQLSKSNEPYHPPRPYKAAPLARRDTTRDSFNDETFGSNETTSEDRAEEERRRRASFEFMRKEQQKAIQEKQKVNVNNHTIDSVSEMSELLSDGREGKNVSSNNELDTTATESFSSTDLGKSALPSQTIRPLVPPGFANFGTEKDSGFKPLGRSDSTEVAKNEAEERLGQSSVQNGTSVPKTSSLNGIDGDQLTVGNQLFLPFLTKGEHDANSSNSLDFYRKTSGIEDHKHQAPIVSEAHDVLDNNSGIVELNSNLSGLSIDGGEFNNKVLERILGDALSVNVSNSTNTVEIRGDKADDTRALKAAPHSSKFARWFVEEETKTTATNDMLSSSPKDLLSLLVGGNKGKLNDSVGDINEDVNHFNQEISSMLGSELSSVKSVSSLSSATISGPDLVVPKQEVVVQKVLTCEDLEQTILSEYTGPGLEVGGGGAVTDAMSEQRPKPRADDHASHHLLSLLLQKGASNTMENSAPPTLHAADVIDKESASDSRRESVEEDKNIQPPPGKALTLETLFGSAFMQELQSSEAPVSIHRGGSGSAGSPREENGVFSSETDHIRSEKTSNAAKGFLTSNRRQKMQLDKTDKWLGYDDPIIDINLSIEPSVVSKTEDESLVSALNLDLNRQFSKLLPGDNPYQIESGNIPISKQFNARHDVGVVDGSPFLSGPFIKHPDRNNLSRDHLHGQTSSTSNFQSMHNTNLGKPLLQQLDPHSAHHMSARGGKFPGTENMIQHDVPSNNQQFPANMLRPSFHHQGMGTSPGVDRTAHHPMLQQLQMLQLQQLQMQKQMQMQMRGGDYPPHLVNDFQRGNQVLPQQAAGFVHEQGYPFGHGQPNIGGQGIPVAAPDVNNGRRNPEAFQRLVEMELRANSKRIPPFSRWQ